MRFLDVLISPFSVGDSATVIFTVCMMFTAFAVGGTALILFLHFQKEQKRAEKRKEKQTATETEE